MKYRVNNFRKLKCYQFSLELYAKIINEKKGMHEEALKIRYGLVKVMSYLAKSTGDILYAKAVIYDLKKAIKWIDYSLEYIDAKYRDELIRIKKMVLGLKKKVEENKDGSNY